MFVWQLYHNRLLTRSRIFKWGVGSPFCYHCNNIEETTLHVLRDCPLARIVWNHLVEAHNRGNFFISSNNQWFQNNIFNHSIHWSELWANTCYWLWTWRNKQIHEEEFTRPYQEWDFIKKYTQEYQNISTYLPIQLGIKSRNRVEVPV